MQGNTIIPIASEKWIRQCITKSLLYVTRYFIWAACEFGYAFCNRHNYYDGSSRLAQASVSRRARCFRFPSSRVMHGKCFDRTWFVQFDSLWWIVMVFFIFSKLYPSVERAWNLVDFTVGTSIHDSSAKEFVMNFKSCANVLPRIVRLTCLLLPSLYLWYIVLYITLN